MPHFNNIRWQQRFSNYKKALGQLEQAILLSRERQLSNLEEQGLIQSFEYTYELAWNVLKDFLLDRGNMNIFGARDAIQEAFKLGLIAQGEEWMNMLKDRNRTSHTYNQQTSKDIANAIRSVYFALFLDLKHLLLQSVKMHR